MADAPERTSIPGNDNKRSNLDFRYVINRFAERTSMHGWCYIHTSKHLVSKTFWATLTIGATVTMCFHLHMMFDQYLLWPKSTTVSLGYTNLRFPAITVCNVNPFKKSLLPKYGTPKLQALVDMIGSSMFNADKNISTNGTSILVDWHRFDGGSSIIDEPTKGDDDWGNEIDPTSLMVDTFRYVYMQVDSNDRKAGGHRICDMLLDCSFNGRRCTKKRKVTPWTDVALSLSLSSDLDENDRACYECIQKEVRYCGIFKPYMSASYGNCFRLEQKRMIAKRSGPDGGLTLILYLQTDEFVAGLTNGYGIKLSVHEQGTKPVPEQDGVFISSATETNVALRKTSITRLGEPYGRCTKGEDFEKVLRDTYSLKMCHLACLADTIIQKCGCWHYMHEYVTKRLNKWKNYAICNTVKERECESRILQRERQKKLKCDCPNKCDDTVYDMSISSRQWPTDEYARVLRQRVCDLLPDECDRLPIAELSKFKNNFVKLNIFYQSLNYESIEEAPLIPLYTFLANVGGTVGLWIGLSTLGVCEVLYMGIELVTCFVNMFWQVVRHMRKTGNGHDTRA